MPVRESEPCQNFGMPVGVCAFLTATGNRLPRAVSSHRNRKPFLLSSARSLQSPRPQYNWCPLWRQPFMSTTPFCTRFPEMQPRTCLGYWNFFNSHEMTRSGSSHFLDAPFRDGLPYWLYRPQSLHHSTRWAGCVQQLIHVGDGIDSSFRHGAMDSPSVTGNLHPRYALIRNHDVSGGGLPTSSVSTPSMYPS